MLLIVVAACQDESAASEPVKTVIYEVITTSGQWYGGYVTETGEKQCVCTLPLDPSGWRHSFEISSAPFDLHLDATSACCSDTPDAPDVTTNIYLDGELVATNTSNWAPGVASVDFTTR